MDLFEQVVTINPVLDRSRPDGTKLKIAEALIAVSCYLFVPTKVNVGCLCKGVLWECRTDWNGAFMSWDFHQDGTASIVFTARNGSTWRHKSKWTKHTRGNSRKRRDRDACRSSNLLVWRTHIYIYWSRASGHAETWFFYNSKVFYPLCRYTCEKRAWRTSISVRASWTLL